MEFFAKTGAAATLRTDCAIVGVYKGGRLSQAAGEIDAVTGHLVAGLVKRGDFTGKPGSTLLVHSPVGITARRLLLVGLGEPGKLDLKGWRKAHGAACGPCSAPARRTPSASCRQRTVPTRMPTCWRGMRPRRSRRPPTASTK
jgi:leucyl aminopeptidase